MGLSVFSFVVELVGWQSRYFRQRLLFMYSYLLFPYLTRCYSILWIILFKPYVFWPYHFSFIVCPSVLDDLPPLVAVASFSDLLRVFNDIVRVSKIAAYLLWGELHMDFSSSNVDDCLNDAEERSSEDDGWIVLVLSHVNNLKVCVDKMIVYFDRDISYYSFNLSKSLIYHLELNVCGF